MHDKAPVDQGIDNWSVRYFDANGDGAYRPGYQEQPVAQFRQTRTTMREFPLSRDVALCIDNARLMLFRAPVDPCKPSEPSFFRHRISSPACTGRHDAYRSLYWRSTARLPTGHPSWPTCRGTRPIEVFQARV